MQHIAAGKIERRRNLGLPCGFLMALFFHNLIAGQAKLNAASAVNGVVNAPVAGHKASPQSAVGRIYNGVRLENRNIPLPEGQTAV